MRIRFNGDKHALGFEFFEDQFGRLWRDRFEAGELTELFRVRAIILQRCDDGHTDGCSDFVVDVATAWSHVNNSGPLARDHIRAAARVTSAVDDLVP